MPHHDLISRGGDLLVDGPRTSDLGDSWNKPPGAARSGLSTAWALAIGATAHCCSEAFVHKAPQHLPDVRASLCQQHVDAHQRPPNRDGFMLFGCLLKKIPPRNALACEHCELSV